MWLVLEKCFGGEQSGAVGWKLRQEIWRGSIGWSILLRRQSLAPLVGSRFMLLCCGFANFANRQLRQEDTRDLLSAIDGLQDQ